MVGKQKHAAQNLHFPLPSSNAEHQTSNEFNTLSAKPEVFESFDVNKSRINSFYLEKYSETLDFVL